MEGPALRDSYQQPESLNASLHSLISPLSSTLMPKALCPDFEKLLSPQLILSLEQWLKQGQGKGLKMVWDSIRVSKRDKHKLEQQLGNSHRI